MDPNLLYILIYVIVIIISCIIWDWMVIALLVGTVFSFGLPLFPIAYWADEYYANKKARKYAEQQEAYRISRLNPLKVKSCEFEIFFATGCILDKKSTYEVKRLNRKYESTIK